MAKVERLQAVISSLEKLKNSKGKNTSVIVGYTQEYAIYVHENLEAHHPVGQAKFLETPARNLMPELGSMITTGVRKGLTLTQSLLTAGLRLQRESQQLCPVDTGALKNSAFTREET